MLAMMAAIKYHLHVTWMTLIFKITILIQASFNLSGNQVLSVQCKIGDKNFIFTDNCLDKSSNEPKIHNHYRFNHCHVLVKDYP